MSLTFFSILSTPFHTWLFLEDEEYTTNEKSDVPIIIPNFGNFNDESPELKGSLLPSLWGAASFMLRHTTREEMATHEPGKNWNYSITIMRQHTHSKHHGKSRGKMALQVTVTVGQQLPEHITHVERAGQARVKLRPAFQSLLPVPGIGRTLARTIMLEPAEMGRFPTVGPFASPPAGASVAPR